MSRFIYIEGPLLQNSKANQIFELCNTQFQTFDFVSLLACYQPGRSEVHPQTLENLISTAARP